MISKSYMNCNSFVKHAYNYLAKGKFPGVGNLTPLFHRIKSHKKRENQQSKKKKTTKLRR